MALQVDFAVYGALKGGGQDDNKAAIVTAALQEKLDQTPNGVVKINNQNMGGDPAQGSGKHFGAIVRVEGVPTAFACREGQTIDFS